MSIIEILYLKDQKGIDKRKKESIEAVLRLLLPMSDIYTMNNPFAYDTQQVITVNSRRHNLSETTIYAIISLVLGDGSKMETGDDKYLAISDTCRKLGIKKYGHRASSVESCTEHFNPQQVYVI